jgi:nucleotide-binding universal stress UspA family protein
MPTYPKLITIERHIADQEHLHKEATGEFSRLLRDLTLAVRVISREVRRAGLGDILGMTGEENVHGEAVKKLDEFANETIIRAMRYGGNLCAMASEESEGLINLDSELTTAAEHAMAELLKRDELQGIHPITAISHGRASSAIIEYAQTHSIDIIVIATHGRTGLEHLIFGSTAERVVRESPCPVLTIHPPHDSSE